MAALPSDPAEAVNRSSLVRVSVLAVFIAGTAIAGHLFSARTDPFAELREWLQQASGAEKTGRSRRAAPESHVAAFGACNMVGGGGRGWPRGCAGDAAAQER